ncbi:hypothetical protein CJF30_00007275 [Rutstroemia sp. NJR-2017a BBW]|nr:hypothetical protein CJF30_00007275 [Rutstroemia sp. NJR-2017a BBW]
MAGSIGRITGALGTVHNENTASLATLNFDFTLVKLEAPAEYTGLGQAISKTRKTNAEEGNFHKTARRLGALFKDLLPETEDLFRAYGTRVSEIASISSMNPTDTSSGAGIFASYYGADSTSIWAAVTSGSAAIAAHLLGCMLARSFSGPEAVTIWVELVQKQKEHIHSKQKKGLYSHEHISEMVAAQQDISRDDISSWDASARAWLQSADQAKPLQHTQTMLILNNAGIPVNNTADIYRSVMKAWTAALEAMNSLVKGMPQRVQDGAALLAFSSWHLYPDMVVYGDTCVEVKQKDPIFATTALLTLGLQDTRDHRDDMKSVYWSLPLSRLQYYGPTVQAHGSVGQANSRITYKQFAYVVLGCLFDGWKLYASTNDEGLRWMGLLATILETSLASSVDQSEKKTWLQYLFAATRNLVECEEIERKAAHQLINLGRRRSTFLKAPEYDPLPLFGLSTIHFFSSVLRTDQKTIQRLRQICSRLQQRSNLLIRYKVSSSDSSSCSTTEYATVEPLLLRSTKRTHEGQPKENNGFTIKHVRWMTLSIADLSLCCYMGKELSDLPSAILTLADLETRVSEGLILPARHLIEELKVIVRIGQRIAEIHNAGELCLPLIETSVYVRVKERCSEITILASKGLSFLSAAHEIRSKLGNTQEEEPMSKTFTAVADADTYSAVIISAGRVQSIPEYILESRFLQEILTTDNIDADRLYDHLQVPFLSQYRCTETYALHLCAMMAEVYRALPGASISTLVLRQSIQLAKWVPKFVNQGYHPASSSSLGLPYLTLPQSFACLAMFESGTCNLEPEALSEVFAMSSGNSLYVANALLFDPYEVRTSNMIQRMVGNVGRAGITFLISPSDVKVSESGPEKWMSINHNVFDGSLENHFSRTSVHLSFTEYEVPLVTDGDSRHIIDRDVVLVEALISVYDGANWVAEIDIPKALRSDIILLPSTASKDGHDGWLLHPEDRRKQKIHMTYQEAFQDAEKASMVSIENWDELIEPPIGFRGWLRLLFVQQRDAASSYSLWTLAGLAVQKWSGDLGKTDWQLYAKVRNSKKQGDFSKSRS